MITAFRWFASPFLSHNFDENKRLFMYFINSIYHSNTRYHGISETTDESSHGLSNFFANFEYDTKSLTRYHDSESLSVYLNGRSFNKQHHFLQFHIFHRTKLSLVIQIIQSILTLLLSAVFFISSLWLSQVAICVCIYTNRKYKVGKWINNSNTPNTNIFRKRKNWTQHRWQLIQIHWL